MIDEERNNYEVSDRQDLNQPTHETEDVSPQDLTTNEQVPATEFEVNGTSQGSSWGASGISMAEEILGNAPNMTALGQC